MLRGSQALVFPLASKYLSLEFQPSWPEAKTGLLLSLGGERGREFESLFWAVLGKACEEAKIQISELTGSLKIESTIPIGSGLGASAALCVALTKWFFSLGLVAETEQYEFARTLEDMFHGESSGVDIAVALSQQGLKFRRGGERVSFSPRWRPKCYISYSGKRGVTVDCVNQVKAMIHSEPEATEVIDQKMRQAVRLAEAALLQPESREAFSELAVSITLAQECFAAWGLVGELPGHHIEMLKARGATAVKMTGSGDGGYVLSLWSEVPPADLGDILISCF